MYSKGYSDIVESRQIDRQSLQTWKIEIMFRAMTDSKTKEFLFILEWIEIMSSFYWLHMWIFKT